MEVPDRATVGTEGIGVFILDTLGTPGWVIGLDPDTVDKFGVDVLGRAQRVFD